MIISVNAHAFVPLRAGDFHEVRYDAKNKIITVDITVPDDRMIIRIWQTSGEVQVSGGDNVTVRKEVSADEIDVRVNTRSFEVHIEAEAREDVPKVKVDVKRD